MDSGGQRRHTWKGERKRKEFVFQIFETPQNRTREDVDEDEEEEEEGENQPKHLQAREVFAKEEGCKHGVDDKGSGTKTGHHLRTQTQA